MSEQKVVATERSQSVYSANWKEDVLLRRKLKEIDTSGRRVVHSIEIDQRVVNKRFQQKLYRSRLAYARLTGNREKLKELLSKDGYKFNTNVCGDDDYTVKLPTANKRASSAPSLRQQVYGGKGMVGRETVDRPATVAVTNPHAKTIDIDDLLMNISNGHRPSRPKSSLSVASRKVKIRPSTALGGLNQAETNGHQVMDDGTDVIDVEMDTEADWQDDDVDDDNASGRRVSVVKHTRFKIDKTSSRPKTAMGFLTTPTNSNVTNRRPNKPRRPKSTSSSTKSKGGLFDDAKKPTLLEIHQEQVKAANYPQKVRRFLTSVKSLQSGNEVDYYTMRVIEDAGKGSKNKLNINCVESLAEKKDALRSIGDLNSRNMTMRTICWDFKMNSGQGESREQSERNGEDNPDDVEMEELNE